QLPEQHNNDSLTREELLRDLLAEAGLREVVGYRLTTPEAEARLFVEGIKGGNNRPADTSDYVTLANPISADKVVMRHTLLNGLLEDIAANLRHHPRQKLFEIGPVFFRTNATLPLETTKLGIALTGSRSVSGWDEAPSSARLDFFDLKGVLETLSVGLRIGSLRYSPTTHPAFHPGRCASILLNNRTVGVMGELHPLVRRAYDLDQSVVAAELVFDELIRDIPLTDKIAPILTQPAVYEDIALIVPENTPAGDLEAAIRKAGGELLRDVRLFDVYRGESIPDGKKSLAYALTYQAEDHTLTDKEAAKVRQQIVKATERQFGAVLRAK
ncbi:MAG TPA: hypothetical protein VMT34_00510, partial [Aggregatilineales bacterium]|nr:hypothetical protein [Aggregatilineales bacterium]